MEHSDDLGKIIFRTETCSESAVHKLVEPSTTETIKRE